MQSILELIQQNPTFLHHDTDENTKAKLLKFLIQSFLVQAGPRQFKSTNITKIFTLCKTKCGTTKRNKNCLYLSKIHKRVKGTDTYTWSHYITEDTHARRKEKLVSFCLREIWDNFLKGKHQSRDLNNGQDCCYGQELWAQQEKTRSK